MVLAELIETRGPGRLAFGAFVPGRIHSDLRIGTAPERYDLSIAAGEGQPIEAVRALFARARRGDYPRARSTSRSVTPRPRPR